MVYFISIKNIAPDYKRTSSLLAGNLSIAGITASIKHVVVFLLSPQRDINFVKSGDFRLTSN